MNEPLRSEEFDLGLFEDEGYSITKMIRFFLVVHLMMIVMIIEKLLKRTKNDFYCVLSNGKSD